MQSERLKRCPAARPEAVVIAFPALFRSADDMVVVDWCAPHLFSLFDNLEATATVSRNPFGQHRRYGCQLPTSGAAAAGAAIVEEACGCAGRRVPSCLGFDLGRALHGMRVWLA